MKYLLILLFFLQFNIISYAQWEPTGGPIGDINIKDIFRYNSSDYVSVKGCGLFKREKTDNTWNQIANYWFTNHTLIGDSLFAYVRGLFGVQGLHFINLKEGIEPTDQIWFFDYNTIENSDSHLYFGWGGAIIRSNYDGTDQTDITVAIPPDEITGPDSKIKSFALTDKLLLCGTRAGIFISSIEDIDWINSSNGLDEGIVSIIQADEDTLYCVVNSNLYKSIDNGQQWSVVYSALSPITSIHANSNSIFVITDDGGIYSSTDQGASWESYLIDNEIKFIDILEFEDDLFFISQKRGMFKIENGMLSDQNKGLVCGSVRDLTTDGESLYAGVGTKIEVKNSLSQWQNISPTDLPYRGITSIHIMDNTIFLSITQNVEGQPFYLQKTIFYSTDKGMTWNEIVNLFPQEGFGQFYIAINEGRLYACENENLYYTEDFGLNWTQLELPEGYCNRVEQFEVYNSNLYVRTCGKGILKLNENDKWTDIGQNLPSGNIGHIMFNDQYIFTRIRLGGFFKSLIDQDEWETLSSIPNDFGSFTDYVNVDSILFISTIEGVLYSTDNGETLKEYNENLMNTFCNSIEYLHDTLYVGAGGNSVWKRYVDNDDFLSTTTEFPSEINIDIFPNPASDRIFVHLNNSESIEVSIFDILGNRVKTSTVDSGELDIRDLPSGTYFLKLYFNQEYIIEKVIIQK